MRGRALASIALLCGTWVTARIAVTTMDIRAVRQTDHGTYPNPVRMGPAPKLASTPTFTHYSSQHGVAAPAVLHAQNSQAKIALPPEGTAPLFFSAGTPERMSPAAFLPTDADVVIPIAAPPPSATTPQGFEVYAYSFWRQGSSPAGMLGNGQYGGSQSAVIAAIPVLRFSGNPGHSRLSMVGRVSVAHGSVREKELAAGMRWRPVARIPVQVIAERRFREDRPGAFAALVAGGQSGVKLPLGFRLDGYGQAGFVSGQGGGPFADVAAQAHRSIAQSQRASFAIGAGIWGGGQDNVMRMDIGPNIRANVSAGGAVFQFDASWRVRVAGHAQPRNGPAVTLSTSF
ncbi:MAG: hypothetical protein RLZZ407_349 [Pseudomonadota bacterium]